MQLITEKTLVWVTGVKKNRNKLEPGIEVSRMSGKLENLRNGCRFVPVEK